MRNTVPVAVLLLMVVLSASARSKTPIQSPANVQLSRQSRSGAAETRYREEVQRLENSPQPLSVDTQSKLANALRRLASIYREADRMQEAEQSLRRLLSIYQELARFQPEAYQIEVSGTLMNLGGIYRDTGRSAEATSAYEEALQMLRGPETQTSGEEARVDLGLALNNLANLYREADRIGEAERHYAEAIAVRRQLADAKPELYKLDLAATLNSVGNLYSRTGRMLDAERVYLESVAIRDELRAAGRRSPEVTEGTALTLTNLARTYVETGRSEEAEKAFSRALDTYRELLKSDRLRHLVAFAETLDQLAQLFFNTNQIDRTIETIHECVVLWRELAGTNPRFRLDLVVSLNRAASLLAVSGRRNEVSPLLDEALPIARQLWQESPEDNATLYAEILVSSAMASDEHSSSCRKFEEAVTIAADQFTVKFAEQQLTRCKGGSINDTRF